MPEKCLEIEGLRQRLYDPHRSEEFTVYVDCNITLYAGDFVSILGPSGCGKTTLLTVLGLLRAPTFVETLKKFLIWVPDAKRGTKEIDLRDAWLRRRNGLIQRIRRKHIGFALQSGELVSSLTVSENIAAPLYLNGFRSRAISKRVDDLIDAFGLNRRRADPDQDRDGEPNQETNGESNKNKPLSSSRINRLSGGEYQRVVLARAIAHRPAIVYVDEPTAALNRELARGALQQFHELQGTSGHQGITVMITHDERLAEEFSNVIIRMAARDDEPAGDVVEFHRIDSKDSADS